MVLPARAILIAAGVAKSVVDAACNRLVGNVPNAVAAFPVAPPVGQATVPLVAVVPPPGALAVQAK